MKLSDDDIKRIAKDGAMGAEFIINFANALQKLRAAEDRTAGCRLLSGEVKAVVTGFRLLKEGRK